LGLEEECTINTLFGDENNETGLSEAAEIGVDHEELVALHQRP